MNNREKYKGAFDKVRVSESITMEDIMAKNKKTFRTNKKIVVVLCCIAVLIVGTVSVNAATGGKVGDYFTSLLGGNDAVAEVTWDNKGEENHLEVNLRESQVGLYDADNKLIKNITEEEVGNIEFAKDNQSCTLDGKEYKVMLVCGVDENTGESQNQVRLYDPADFEKAGKSFNPNQVFGEDNLTVYCPYITVE